MGRESSSWLCGQASVVSAEFPAEECLPSQSWSRRSKKILQLPPRVTLQVMPVKVLLCGISGCHFETVKSANVLRGNCRRLASSQTDVRGIIKISVLISGEHLNRLRTQIRHLVPGCVFLLVATHTQCALKPGYCPAVEARLAAVGPCLPSPAFQERKHPGLMGVLNQCKSEMVFTKMGNLSINSHVFFMSMKVKKKTKIFKHPA